MLRPQLAVIAPIALQNTLDMKYQLIGDYHLLLAHQVMEHRDAYIEYYANVHRMGRDPVIIMDNSLVELGTALRPETLAQACAHVGASYLVLPDVMRDPWKTVDSSVAAWIKLRDMVPEYTKFMAVVQATKMANAIWCMDKFAELIGRGIGAIAVPRVVGNDLGSRLPVVQTVAKRLGVPIHLLGFSNNLADDIVTSMHPSVMGIDSAYPVWSGRLEIMMHGTSNYDVSAKRPHDFWEYRHVAPAMVYNIMQFRRFFER